MHIGIDVDGVLADFTAACVAAARREGITVRVDPHGPRDFGFTGWFDAPEDRDHAIAAALDACADMALLDVTAAEAVHRLRGEHRVSIVTARRNLLGGSDAAVQDGTRSWLAAHGIIADAVVFAADKTAAGLDVLLDDAPHNIAAAREAGLDAVIYDQPYNQTLLGPRAYSVGGFAALVA